MQNRILIALMILLLAPLASLAGDELRADYLPTEQQRGNTGYAQEDRDCLVAPEWQKLFETKALAMLKKL
jgi:hypothetical protein